MKKSFSHQSIIALSVIMEAHIGIGIYGEEKIRAVLASDFEIGEFKVLLHRLLFFHGRIIYMWSNEAVLNFFYKNFVFNYPFLVLISQLLYRQTIIYEWFITLHNLVFTLFSLSVRA